MLFKFLNFQWLIQNLRKYQKLKKKKIAFHQAQLKRFDQRWSTFTVDLLKINGLVRLPSTINDVHSVEVKEINDRQRSSQR